MGDVVPGLGLRRRFVGKGEHLLEGVEGSLIAEARQRQRRVVTDVVVGIGEEGVEPVVGRAGLLLPDDAEREGRRRAQPGIFGPRGGHDGFGDVDGGRRAAGGGEIGREDGDRLDGGPGHLGLGGVSGPLDEGGKGFGNGELPQSTAEVDAEHLRLLASPAALRFIGENPAEFAGEGGIGLERRPSWAAEVVGEIEGRLPAPFVVAAERADVGLRVLAEVGEPVEGEPDADDDRDDQPRHEEQLHEKPRARWLDRREELVRRHRPAGFGIVGGRCHGSDRRGERGGEDGPPFYTRHGRQA